MPKLEIETFDNVMKIELMKFLSPIGKEENSEDMFKMLLIYVLVQINNSLEEISEEIYTLTKSMITS